MEADQPEWPRRWLMTDERLGDRLWAAIDVLPCGAGIIFRHYSLDPDARRELGHTVMEKAREKDLVLGVAGSRQLADELGAALIHNPETDGVLCFSLAVHNRAEAEHARRSGAALAFISPLSSTRSHPDATPLALVEAVALAKIAQCRAIALGGMSERRFVQLEAAVPGVFHGYAGIDCWL